jgi:hypothetical protein
MGTTPPKNVDSFVMAVCKGCDGTGLTPYDKYRHQKEKLPRDTLRICDSCDGSGSFKLFYKAFAKRTPPARAGVRYVQLYHDDFFEKANKITITEFYSGRYKKDLA